MRERGAAQCAFSYGSPGSTVCGLGRTGTVTRGHEPACGMRSHTGARGAPCADSGGPGGVTRGHEPARGKRGAASVSTVISASVGGHEPACGARGAAPVSPQFSRPPGRSSLGRAEAGRPGGPGPHQSGATHLCRRWGTDWPEARVGTGLGLAGPHGPAPGLRHPEPGASGRGPESRALHLPRVKVHVGTCCASWASDDCSRAPVLAGPV